MCIIYILKLEGGYFYVGRTDDIENRIKAHENGKGCKWTEVHKFVSVYKILYDQDIFEEDKQVKKMMAIHGIDKVRGGAYATLTLTNDQKKFINKEIMAANDICYTCAQEGHFAAQCPSKRRLLPQPDENPECVIA